jgi:hypothetical protein
MNCIACGAVCPDGNKFCGQCGAEVGRTLPETILRNDLRDRRTIEMELTDNVLTRLVRWGGWLAAIGVAVLAAFGLALSLVYHDAKSAAEAGKAQIEATVKSGEENITTNLAEATREVSATKQNADQLLAQVKQLQSDVRGFKEVTDEMETLRKQFHGQTEDLKKLDLRVHSVETVGTEGPPALIFTRLGCKPSPLAKGGEVAYCSEGSPPFLFQVTSKGDIRPVSSASPSGFQDVSTGPIPTCDANSRGTFYAKKGNGNENDAGLLCARKSDHSFGWVQLSSGPDK